MGAHSRRDIHYDRYARSGMRLVGALIAVCVAAVIGVAIIAAIGEAPAPQVEAAASSVATPRDPTVTPQARAFLAEIYREGVGPDVLDARGAVLLATGVCEQNRARVGLATLSQNVSRMFPKLSRIHAATLVDDAIKFYCPV